LEFGKGSVVYKGSLFWIFEVLPGRGTIKEISIGIILNFKTKVSMKSHGNCGEFHKIY
jgi:hypothetical protein